VSKVWLVTGTSRGLGREWAEAALERGDRVAATARDAAAIARLLAIVDAPEPPLRVFLGRAPLGIAAAEYESRLRVWREWEAVSLAAHGE
jgi:NAD(P)-dependent dehydrogenase (short-subunit alcohol dehydrogenase family)